MALVWRQHQEITLEALKDVRYRVLPRGALHTRVHTHTHDHTRVPMNTLGGRQGI